MQLTSEETEELARFFARRFPDAQERSSLLGEAGLGSDLTEQGDPEAAWMSALSEPGADSRMLALVHAAIQRRPGDENLRELLTTVDPPSTLSGKALVGGLLVLMGLGAWLGWTMGMFVEQPMGAHEHYPTGMGQGAPHEAGHDHPEPMPPAQEQAPAQEQEQAPAAEAVDAEEQPPEPDAEQEPVDAAPEPPQVRVPMSTRCAGEPGELVGYWYAGSPFEAKAGQVYTMKVGANVRADYPRPENSWSSRAAVRCSLVSGDRVRIERDPILVDGGKYWVPLLAGNLLVMP